MRYKKNNTKISLSMNGPTACILLFIKKAVSSLATASYIMLIAIIYG